MKRRRDRVTIALCGAVVLGLMGGNAALAETATPPPASVPTPAKPPPAARKIHAVDADNQLIVVNRPTVITLVLGTNENSQDGARSAGIAVYPLQGRPDFQLIVVVDLRDSIATWMPALVLSKMRSNLDHEAVELKPYYLKNGNKTDPRKSSYVIPDFGGTICPQLGWPETSDDLRGILYGADGREIKRWDKLEDMDAMQSDVRAAIQALIDADQARTAMAAKNQGTKLMQPPTPHPPLQPPMKPQG